MKNWTGDVRNEDDKAPLKIEALVNSDSIRMFSSYDTPN